MTDPVESVALQFKLRVGDVELDVRSRVPSGETSLRALLPAIQPIASSIVDAAVQPVAGVSCRAGCGACCRQPVPIAESEAELLVDLIESMPEARRRAVVRRFERGLERLAEHGLLEALEDLNDVEDLDARQRLGRAYFDLQIPCPFLEDESCGIHPDRPLACREYLVTSPAEACASPSPEAIEMVPIPARPSVALYRMDEAGAPRPARSLVLILARRFVAGRSGPAAPRTKGPQLLERWVRGLAGGR